MSDLKIGSTLHFPKGYIENAEDVEWITNVADDAAKVLLAGFLDGYTVKEGMGLILNIGSFELPDNKKYVYIIYKGKKYSIVRIEMVV